ncbi:cutinase family protein [Mycobacterium cookii]|uniref:Cutinase n=1 Tax=Mycobacterium cookii TaxID=1775 RepID=A0A7I7L2H5_9MYCO|nr:cutinase family protein [Mycobacterium cookii]MCV7333024.1 cutinase family protein [Mycobacterium cookii]BBX48264.1 putative cutinase cut2 [Mycobacterium cookii]
MRLRLARLAAATLSVGGLLSASALAPIPSAMLPVASAACPDAEVTFARGREEPPGVGLIGQSFIDALRAKVPRMTVGSYGVNYPANTEIDIAANDMSAHAQSMAASCPNTKLVLGGYSLGAAAADVVVGVNRPGFGFMNPLPPSVDDHVAAVALFGNGTQRVLGPATNFSPAFAGKTIDLCAANDPICTRSFQNLQWAAHLQPSYVDSGLINKAANFVAAKL